MLRFLGWALTAVLCALALVSLAPAVVGLSMTTPVAQAIALRPLLAVGSVLALSETSRSSAEAIADELAERTDTTVQLFAQTSGRWDANATALLVSDELGEYQEAAAPETWHASVRAEPVDGQGPTLLAVHPLSPHEPGAATDRWAADLEAVAQVCRTEPRAIVAGDFNATLDHAPLRDIGPCVDASVEGGVGGVATWPAHLPRLLGAPIDHVLVDAEHFAVDAAVVLEVGGSDHRAVVARLSPG